MYLVVGLSFALSGLLSPSGFLWFALFTATAGISSSVFNASFVSVIQTRIEAGVLGRVMSLYPQFRPAARSTRTARHGIPGRKYRSLDNLHHRRNGHRSGRPNGFLHPFGHAARPQGIKKRRPFSEPPLFSLPNVSSSDRRNRCNRFSDTTCCRCSTKRISHRAKDKPKYRNYRTRNCTPAFPR